MFARKDYTARDYASIVNAVKAYIAVEYPDLELSWEKMSPEQLFLDINAFIGDGHHLYIDSAFSEFFVDSMAEQQSGVSLGEWVGYEAPMLTAPSVSVTYTYTSTGPSSYILPRGTTVKDRKGNSWTTIEDQVIGVAGGTITFYQGTYVTDSWAGSGAPNQEIVTSRKGVASNVTPVVTLDGNSATEVEYLLNVGTGWYFESRFGADTKARLRFGDGINGNTVSTNISVEYFVTKGLEGRVRAGVVRGKYSPTSEITIEYTNPSAVTDGGNVASIETIRRAIPAYVSSLNTLVTKEDYRALIDAYPGIQFSSVAFNPLLRQNEYFIMSTSYGPVSEYTLRYLNSYLKGKYQINSSGVFKNIDFAPIILKLKVYLESSMDVQKSQVQSNINTAIVKFFQPGDGDNIYCETGKPIRLSDLYGMIENIAGVSYVEIEVFTRKPQLRPVNWVEGSTPIVLDSWALRPTFRLNEQNSYGMSSDYIGDLNPSQIGLRPVKLNYNNMVSGSSISEHSDWTPTLGMVPLEKVVVTMNNSYGNYTWTSWSRATEGMVNKMMEALQITLSEFKTAHFKVSHFIDSTEHIDTGLGYLGTSYQIDAGSFTFILESHDGSDGDTDYTSETVYLNNDYVAFLYGKNIRPGTISGTAVFDSTLSNITDNGTGGIVLSTGELMGIVDYDKGIIVMNDAYVCTDVELDYSSMNFENRCGDETEILLSPYSHTIAMDKNEYPLLYSLDLEVGIE